MRVIFKNTSRNNDQAVIFLQKFANDFICKLFLIGISFKLLKFSLFLFGISFK